MRMELLKSEFSISRLDADAPLPEWPRGDFFSVTRTAEELSIVHQGRGFRCLKVEGPLDFSLVGILASLTATLARAEVPVFAISTFDTDYLLVRTEQIERAIAALEENGHDVRR
ncbi:MAG TPA: ACT domain-containing protein [Bryobacteraceae bacterium]|nr:ACT domain-containing protein [Bryobacteraceae bacterium]